MMAPEGQFTRLVNARFFDADGGGLRTRHIKWLDLIPCEYDDSGTEVDKFSIYFEPYFHLASLDLQATYPLPDDFRLERLQQVNRFVEFIGNRANNETDITRLIASEDFRFILKMRFSAQEIHSERPCEWQSSAKEPIRPDFFVVGTDGFADIVEFKLPWVKSAIVVGTSNRETFSAVINSYVSQTRVYRDYFDDPRNRDHVQSLYGFKVYKPKRYLVIGRRWDLNNDEWRAIAADFRDLNVLTYDDIVDGVVTQFYG
jgi:hypothetical protein